MIELSIRYRAQGIRWPLRAGDQLELYERGELLSAFDAAWLLVLVEREVHLAHWRAILAAAPADEWGPLERRPGATAPSRAELRTRRRQRSSA